MPIAVGANKTGLISPVAFFAGLVLMAGAPLFRGGNRHLALIVLEGLALLLVLAVLIKSAVAWPAGPSPANGRKRWRLADSGPSWMLSLLVLSPILMALIYLTPMPVAIWRDFGDRGIYLQGMDMVGVVRPTLLPLSLNPPATWVSLLAALPLIAGLLLGYFSRMEQVRAIARVVIVVAFLEVLVGLVQLALGGESWLYFDGGYPDSAIGTFANRSHYANFLVMALMLYLWLGFTATQADPEPGRRKRRSHSPGSLSHVEKLLWGAGAGVLLLGILISRSRGAALTGLPVMLVAFVMAMLLRGGRFNWRLFALALLAAALGTVALLGLDFVSARYMGGSVSESASFRHLIVESTMEGARAFWPWGAGWGTFESVYPRFQPETIGGYVEYAHHDYAQILFEGGIFGAALLALWAGLYVLRAARLAASIWQSSTMVSAESLIAVVSGLGLLAVMAHAFAEFNMHIPANGILACFLAGLYMRPLPARGTS